MDEWQMCMRHFLEQEYQHSNSPDTLRAYCWTLDAFFSLSPNKSPGEMTRADVETFLSSRLDGKRGVPAVATRNQRLAILKAFYSYAQDYDVERDGTLAPLFIGRNPTHGLRAGKAPHVYKDMTGEEIRRFFSAIPDTLIGKRDRALFLTYFYTARRCSEILNLKWGDIAEGTVIDAHGRSRRGHTYRFHNKGRHREQVETAELPAPAYDAICSYLRACGRYEQMQAHSYVFVSFRRGPGRNYIPTEARLGDDATRDAMKRRAAAAGLDAARLSPHSWRHSSARERYELGSDIREVQHLLLHTSLATTDIYLRALTSPSDPGATLLESVFRGL